MKKAALKSKKNFNMQKIDFEKLNEKCELEETIERERKKFHTARAQPYSMKSHVLDYVFKFHRQKIQSNKADKSKLEDYIYDLENTWSINTEILINMIQDNNLFTLENKKQICLQIDRIKELVNKKKSLRENKMKIRGKLLMDKQIMEEHKRRNEENNAYYSEQKEEIKENLEKKESFIKQFLKKFTEVEIYIQREAKSYPSKWEHLENFEILAFINMNESLNRRKMEIIQETQDIREDMNVILRENVELKKRDEYIDVSDDNYEDDQNTKFIRLINNYKSKIKYFENNNENLKNILNNLTTKWEKLNSISMFRYNRPLIPHQRNISLSVPGHKKINSKAEIFFKELNIVTENNDGDKSNNNKIIEEVNEHCEENNENEEKGEENDEKQEIPQRFGIFNEVEDGETEVNNKSGLLNISHRDDSIMNNNYNSIFNQNILNRNRSDFTLNREQWDISCIENI